MGYGRAMRALWALLFLVTVRGVAGGLPLCYFGMTCKDGAVDAFTTPGSVTTAYGSPDVRDNVEGVGTNARLNDPHGLTYTNDGKWALICDTSNNMVKKVEVATNSVTNAVGRVGASGTQDGVGTNALLSGPLDVAIPRELGDPIAFMLTGNSKLLTLLNYTDMHAISVTTLAGGGTLGDGIGTNMAFSDPRGVAVLGATYSELYVYVCDVGTHSISRMYWPTKQVTRIVGTGS
ncbi:MAG: hypothetical protein EB075_11570, partial [Bacteroidetes bacterium]|nr:hypothetical protein [Bacteroidota bacterium]